MMALLCLYWVENRRFALICCLSSRLRVPPMDPALHAQFPRGQRAAQKRWMLLSASLEGWRVTTFGYPARRGELRARSDAALHGDCMYQLSTENVKIVSDA